MSQIDTRGIYIVHRHKNKVSGHYISVTASGRNLVHRFNNCTLKWVVEAAEQVIHEPKVYQLHPDPIDDAELKLPQLDSYEDGPIDGYDY
jgi:hypothetical protein